VSSQPRLKFSRVYVDLDQVSSSPNPADSVSAQVN